jgi:8-oxo-dGTP diphosphatase
MNQPFKDVRIRVCSIVQCADEIVLVHRRKNDQDSYTIPGGNLDDGEDITSALKRELNEELGINFDHVKEEPLFIGFQDQMVSRPGTTPPPRKLHLIFQLIIDPYTKSGLATTETDDLGVGDIVWMKIQDAEKVHLYPAVGPLLKDISKQRKSVEAKLLPPMTDLNFTWK